ncbi:hypothetical protein CBL_10037 [Carabus blaptoides fortunei]
MKTRKDDEIVGCFPVRIKEILDIPPRLGHKVFLHNPAAKIGLSKKSIKPWEGPYCIAEILGPFTYRITEIEGKKEQVKHVNRLKQFFVNFDTKPSSEEQEEDRDEENDDDTNDFRPLIPAKTSIPPSSRHQNSLNENENQNETFEVIEQPLETREEHEYIDEEESENPHCPTGELTNEIEAGTSNRSPDQLEAEDRLQNIQGFYGKN